MPDPKTTMNELHLEGLKPRPLISYLKALGVLRLVAEQKDPEVRGAWRDGHFVLSTRLSREELLRFLVEEYEPSPIFSPWNAGGGFVKENRDVDLARESNTPRWERLKQCHQDVQAQLEATRDRLAPGEGFGKFSDPKEHKKAFLTALRNGLSERSLRWLDVCWVPIDDGWSPFRLLGTGGNDGRAEFGSMFLKTLSQVVPAKGSSAKKSQRAASIAAAEMALFDSCNGAEVVGKQSLMSQQTLGQFAPSSSGGPNLNNGFGGEKSRLTNPWDLVLGFEGCLLIQPAATSHADQTRGAAFPFQVEAAKGAGGATTEEEDVPAELWMPLWSGQALAVEVQRLFSEGRARVGRRAARNSVDLARAVVTHGIDRGVTAFERYAFPQRNGKNHLAVPAGTFHVRDGQGEERLLRELDPWLESWHRATRDAKTTPARFQLHRRLLDRAVINVAQFGGKQRMVGLLEEVGAAQRALCTAPKFRVSEGFSVVSPLQGLSPAWVQELHDGSHEFELAWSIAGLGAGGTGLPVRMNLEPVEGRGRTWKWISESHSGLGLGLSNDLSDLMLERAVQVGRSSKEAGADPRSSLVLSSRHNLSASTVLAFLDGRLDEERTGRLVHALLGVTELPTRLDRPSEVDHAKAESLPRAYALLKLGLLPEWASPRALMADNDPPSRRLEVGVLHRLRAGHLGAASEIVRRRLRSESLRPLDGTVSYPDPRRLAAALTLPITKSLARDLCRLVLPAFDTESQEA